MISSVLLFPLLSSIICGLFNKKITDKLASIISVFSISISAICALFIFINMLNHHVVFHVKIMEWFSINNIVVSWSIYLDELTAIMFLIVTLVSAVVHVYSIGYMHNDENLPRFMSYLSLFTFFMLLLVASDNFLQLFVGWEGVGFCSYLLIGFWYKKDSATKASIKAFIVNRIGDLAFILAIVMIIYYTGRLDFLSVFERLQTMDKISIDIICLMLFIGAMGKSAQIGLHVWLPDAMEGPTPVSALIHAATMVTAGVFLVARCSFLFEVSPFVLNIVASTGAFTCLFAATIALGQNDIKKIIAYSTCSQLGYMFLACGVSSYSAAIFHLGTHAFFKAMLFLAAGSVIHSSNIQDIRKMGGLAKKMPYTYILFWIGSLAIIGICPLAGYYSKDMILESVAGSDRYDLFTFGIVAAFFTALYSIKIIMLVFHGETKMSISDFNHVHESPKVMIMPLIILAVGSIFAGYYGYHFLNIGAIDGYFKNSLALHSINDHHLSYFIELLPLIVGSVAILLAIMIFRKNIWIRIAKNFGILGDIVANKYYIDEIYGILFVRPVFYLSKVCKFFDQFIIDRFGPGSGVFLVKQFTKITSKIQSGYIFNYALFMLLGLLVGMTWFIVIYIGRMF